MNNMTIGTNVCKFLHFTILYFLTMVYFQVVFKIRGQTEFVLFKICFLAIIVTKMA